MMKSVVAGLFKGFCKTIVRVPWHILKDCVKDSLQTLESVYD